MEENKLEEIKPEDNTQTIFTTEDFSMDGYDKHIRQARNACFISGGLLLINAFILFSKYDFDISIMWLDYLLWFIYIGGFVFCGFLTKTKPYTAIIGALCVFALFIIVNAIINPASIFGGIIFKVAICITLIKGLSDAKEAQQMKAQMEK